MDSITVVLTPILFPLLTVKIKIICGYAYKAYNIFISNKSYLFSLSLLV